MGKAVRLFLFFLFFWFQYTGNFSTCVGKIKTGISPTTEKRRLSHAEEFSYS